MLPLRSGTAEEDFSPEFRDFLAKCLVKDPAQRPEAKELLSHPFLQKARRRAQ